MTEDAKRPSTESPAERQHRMRHDWRDLIEDLIGEGQEQGLFDNLPGAGKPLNLNKNPYAADQALAHELLKDNDLPPAWIGDRRDLLAQVAALRSEIGREWAWHEQAHRLARVADQAVKLAISWDDACQRWQTKIAELNGRIDRYNLKRPVENMELFKLTLDDELARAAARRYL